MGKIFREIKTSSRLEVSKNVNFAPHFHDDIELVYVIRGAGQAYCDGRAYPLSRGSVFLTFPNQIHSYRECEDGEYVLLIIKPSRLLYLQELFRDQKPVNAVCWGDEELAKPLLAAVQERHSRGDGLVVDGYLTAFFGKLFENMTLENRGVSADTVSQVLQYCISNYTQGVCIQDICDHLHISRSYVSHLFSEQLHISFPEYINALRLNKAVELMKHTGLNVTQVSREAGFPTVRTFNRVFRERFGCSPLEYRKRRAERR